jgi:molybdopterin converting factor small subunit
MVEINLWSGLKRFADGRTVVPVEGRTLREILDALTTAHPGLVPFIKAGVSVAVNGQIVVDLSTPVGATDEVYLIQRVKGG